MEGDVGNSIEYWVSVSSSHRASLYDLRQWSHLKIAVDEDLIWIRGFTSTEIESVKVLRIPSAKKYYLKATKLHVLGHRLPYKIEPSLLWTDIQRGLSLSLPTQNFNYFGMDQTHSIAIAPSNNAHSINVTAVKLDLLCAFVKTAANIRMAHLQWTILNDTHALIIGEPLLPIQGKDFYSHGCFIIPGGWKLKYEIMLAEYEKFLPDSSTCWFKIDEKNLIQKVDKSEFAILIKGSVLQSMNFISQLAHVL